MYNKSQKDSPQHSAVFSLITMTAGKNKKNNQPAWTKSSHSASNRNLKHQRSDFILLWVAGCKIMNVSVPHFLFFATSPVLFHSWLVRVCSTGARGRSGATAAPSLSVSSPVAENAVRATAPFLILSFALCRGLAKLSGLLVNATTCRREGAKQSLIKRLMEEGAVLNAL